MNHKGHALVALLILIGAVLLIGALIGAYYNGLVKADVGVQQSWSNVQTAYQRRIDLIPNLVSTVQGSADFEAAVQEKVAALRSGASNAKTPEEINAVDGQLANTINFVYENYPQLRSTENFLTLQAQLEGTENRIKFERDNYNAAVASYVLATRTFPGNIFAGMFGFSSDKYNMFTSEPTADQAPKVGFNFTK